MGRKISDMSREDVRLCEVHWTYNRGIRDGRNHTTYLEESYEPDGITHYVIWTINAMTGFEAMNVYEDEEKRISLARDVLSSMIEDTNVGKIPSEEGQDIPNLLTFPMDWDAYTNGFKEGVKIGLSSDRVVRLTADEISFRIEERMMRRGC